MSLEAEKSEQLTHGPAGADQRRASTERRGKERRQIGNRVNKEAPRRSTLQALGVNAVGVSAAAVAIIVSMGEFVVGAMPWVPLGVALTVFGFAALAFMIGCVEQRLIEIRLELMILNGGARKADRRQGERRV